MNFRLLWILMVGLFAYLLFWEWSQESAAKAELVATTRVDEVSSGVDTIDSSDASKISNDFISLVVNSSSGSIIGVQLSEYPVLQKAGSPNVRLLGSEGAFKFYIKSGFGVESQGVPTQNVIDPYQKYTGVAPPALIQKEAVQAPVAPPALMTAENLTNEVPSSPSLLDQITTGLGVQNPFNIPNAGGAFVPNYGEYQGMNEGGETSIDPLIKEAKAFIMGETEDDSIVQKFVEKYGTDAYLALREEVLQSLIPNAQTE